MSASSHRVLAFNGKKGVLSPETINQSKKDLERWSNQSKKDGLYLSNHPRFSYYYQLDGYVSFINMSEQVTESPVSTYQKILSILITENTILIDVIK